MSVAGEATPERAPRVGVLALQGGFEAHRRMLERLGADVRDVRVPEHLAGLGGLVVPGGESTTMMLGIEREGLAGPLRAFAAERPVFGTCAGLIVLDREHVGIMDVRAERNAFGRQTHSFEEDLDLDLGVGRDGGPVRAVFIRAPWIAEHGPGVEILASVAGHGVAAREGHALVVSFHPELSGETRLHERFLRDVRAAGGD